VRGAGCGVRGAWCGGCGASMRRHRTVARGAGLKDGFVSFSLLRCLHLSCLSVYYKCTLDMEVIMEASALDLRKNMREVMAAIDRNERVTLIYRGRRKAVIIPFDEASKPQVKVADHPAFGIWADRHDLDDVPAYVRELRKPRSL
jgi:hypothetical protein